MDLGMTALGNWKAQQGGCTHIQVRSPTPTVIGAYLKVGESPFSLPPPSLFLAQLAVLQRDQ